MAEKAKQTAAGIFTTGFVRNVLANSKGLSARYEQIAARNFPSRFSRKILRAGPSRIRPTFVTSIPTALSESASRKAPRVRASRANWAGPLHGDSRAVGRARFCRFAFLRFCRNGGARQAFLPQRAHGQEDFRRKHHSVGRRLSSAASWARRRMAKGCRGRKCCWWIAAFPRIWFIRGPPRRK